MAHDALKLRKPVENATCDHMDRDGNMYRQIAVRYTNKGKLSSWEHIQPSRPWDYLLLISLEVKKLRFYKMSRSKGTGNLAKIHTKLEKLKTRLIFAQ